MGYGKMKYGKGGAMKAVPKNNKGLAKLPTAVRNKMGYMMNGGEKLLNKMTYGGASMDMSDPMVKRMRMGGSTANTYSETKRTKQAGAGSSKPMSTKERQEKEAKAKGLTY